MAIQEGAVQEVQEGLVGGVGGGTHGVSGIPVQRGSPHPIPGENVFRGAMLQQVGGLQKTPMEKTHFSSCSKIMGDFFGTPESPFLHSKLFAPGNG